MYGIGQGAILPVIAHSAQTLGASVALAGFAMALIGVGKIVADLPVGAMVARIGERRAMLLAVALDVAALLTCIYATDLWQLCVAIGATGMSGAVWALARQSFVADAVPLWMRARAMSTLGGAQRIGMFVGPFVAAGAIGVLGTVGAYWVDLAASVIAGIALLCAPKLASDTARAEGPAGRRPTSVWTMIGNYRTVLATLGMCTLLVAAVRACRQVAIPLWSAHIGLDSQSTALIFGFSGAVDMLLFYPAGKIMDKYGRAWVAVPSVVVLAVSLVIMQWTSNFAGLTAVALAMGVGNGIAAGLVMTLGTDVSPAADRAAFLGAWRLLADGGNAGGPLALSGIAAVLGLGGALAVVGAAGIASGWLLALWIPKYGAPTGDESAK
nr:MFS transporter [Spelaeicoccus albus]